MVTKREIENAVNFGGVASVSGQGPAPSKQFSIASPSDFVSGSPARSPISSLNIPSGTDASTFIQEREKLINQFAGFGHSNISSRRMANQLIARQLDVLAGATQNIFGGTNQSSIQIGAGARASAEKQAGGFVPALGTSSELTPLGTSITNAKGETVPLTKEGTIAAGFTAVGILALGASLISGISSTAGAAKAFAGRGLTSILGGGAVGALLRGQQSQAKQILKQSEEQLQDLTDFLKMGAISEEEAFMQLQKINDNLNTAERTVKTLNSNKVLEFVSGGKDVAQDYEFARQVTLPIYRQAIIDILVAKKAATISPQQQNI